MSTKTNQKQISTSGSEIWAYQYVAIYDPCPRTVSIATLPVGSSITDAVETMKQDILSKFTPGTRSTPFSQMTPIEILRMLEDTKNAMITIVANCTRHYVVRISPPTIANLQREFLDENDGSKSCAYEASEDAKPFIIENPKFISKNIRRGDVVHFGDDRYRNEGKMIYDGEKLIELDEDLDEYGHLPLEFTLNEFPDYEYFSSTIDHNNIRWLRIDDVKNIAWVSPKNEGDRDVGLFEVLTEGGHTYDIELPKGCENLKTPKELFDELMKNAFFIENNKHLALELSEEPHIYIVYGFEPDEMEEDPGSDDDMEY